jgi:RHS repeat-associated protein
VGGALAASYTYDANNLRTSKTVGGVTTYFVYGMGGKLYGEYDANGDTIREYVYLNGAPLAQIEGGSTESLLYVHTDHLGTPRYATNTSAAQLWNWTSDAFGNGAPTGSATVNLRFPGQYYDDESGLHYNWNRYYNPDTGRYVSSDPIGLDGGLNTYAYVNANPVMFTDPEGLQMKSCAPGDLLCEVDNHREEKRTTGRKRCPSNQKDILEQSGWKETFNNFHCGFPTYVEDDHEPTDTEAVNECTYDHDGCFVPQDDTDFPNCAGTPNQSAKLTYDHWFGNDPGGVAQNLDAVTESLRLFKERKRKYPKCCPK